MTGPKKPGGPLVAHQALVALDAPPIQLTAAERELIEAYRGMTPWARSLVLDMTRKCFKKWPLNIRPSLRLIAGGHSITRTIRNDKTR